MRRLNLEAFKPDQVSWQFVDVLGCDIMPDAFLITTSTPSASIAPPLESLIILYRVYPLIEQCMENVFVVFVLTFVWVLDVCFAFLAGLYSRSFCLSLVLGFILIVEGRGVILTCVPISSLRVFGLNFGSLGVMESLTSTPVSCFRYEIKERNYHLYSLFLVAKTYKIKGNISLNAQHSKDACNSFP